MNIQSLKQGKTSQPRRFSNSFASDKSDGSRHQSPQIYRKGGTQLKVKSRVSRSQKRIMYGGLMGTAALPHPTEMEGGGMLDNVLPEFKKLDIHNRHPRKMKNLHWDAHVAEPMPSTPRKRDATLLLDPQAKPHADEMDEKIENERRGKAMENYVPDYPMKPPSMRLYKPLYEEEVDPSPLGRTGRGATPEVKSKRLIVLPKHPEKAEGVPQEEDVILSFINGFQQQCSIDLFIKMKDMDHAELEPKQTLLRGLRAGRIKDRSQISIDQLERGVVFLLCDEGGLNAGSGLSQTLLTKDMITALPSFIVAFEDGPLGLELEHDPHKNLVVVRRCIEGSQSDTNPNIVSGCLLIGVGSKRIRSLNDFEIAIKLRKKSEPFEVHFIHPSSIQDAQDSELEEIDTDIEGQEEDQLELSAEAKEIESEDDGPVNLDQFGGTSKSEELAEESTVMSLPLAAGIRPRQRSAQTYHSAFSSGSGFESHYSELAGELLHEDRAKRLSAADSSLKYSPSLTPDDTPTLGTPHKQRENLQLHTVQSDEQSSLGISTEDDKPGEWNFTTGGGFVNEEDEVIAGRRQVTDTLAQMKEKKVSLPLRLGCSLEDDEPAVILFSNTHLQRGLEVSWLDYDGALAVRRLLKPGETYMESTYTTHPWIARAISYDEDGNHIEHRDEYLVLRLGSGSIGEMKAYSVLWQPGDQNRSFSFLPQSRADLGAVKVPSEKDIKVKDPSARARKARAELIQQVRNLRQFPGFSSRIGGGAPNLSVMMFGTEDGLAITSIMSNLKHQR